MGFTLANKGVVIVVLFASMLAGTTMANRDWRPRWWHHPNKTQVLPSKIVVGGSENWRFNFSYMNWAYQHGPFYQNDILVFKYDPPVGNDSHPHSVYQLPNLWSFINCDLSNAKKLANATQGAGEGFQFPLDKWQPYYFACGESNGFHCKVGLMKFFVMPMPHGRRS